MRALEKTVRLCRELGHEVFDVDLHIDGKAFSRAYFTMMCCETRATMEEDEILLGRKLTPKSFEPATWILSLLGKKITGSDLSKAIHFLQSTSRPVARWFQNFDVLLTPTLSRPPLEQGEIQPKGLLASTMKLLAGLNSASLVNRLARIDSIVDQTFEFMPFTALFNVTGQPAMSVPLYWNEAGLPIGMQFVGRYGDEATLFTLAAQLEQAQPWANRIPPFALIN